MRLAVPAVLLLPSLLLAGAGEEGFQHLAEGPGARAAGMGGTGISLGGDVDAAFWNPAALATVRGRELGLSHAARAASVTDESASYAHGLRRGGIGARVFLRRAADIGGYDSSGDPTAGYEAGDSVAALGVGHSLGRRLKLGAAVKQARQEIAGFSGSAVALDAGALYYPRGWPVTFGAGVRNVGGQATFLQGKTSLPRLIDGGGSARLFSGAVIAALEGHRSADGFFWNAGAEFWAYNTAAFRLGMDSRRDAGGGVSLGLGIKLRRARVDYALLPQGRAFGNSHRVSLSFRFGGGGEAAYQEGLSLSQKGDHAAALLKFKEALDADPDHPGAARALKEAAFSLERERSRP